ncbi:uncharacterized protein [Temnothorax longispinosus]|uniref:uncharacterized protein n=1 Tax=Temnothorax longispinosus TaxID=300112 RepID=UPI003A98E041
MPNSNAAVEELLARQTQFMSSVFRALPNLKKLGQANITVAVLRQRLASLKETFHKCQELDGRIHFLADDKVKASHAYFQDAQFVTCEDSYNEAADYFAERLHGMEAHDNAAPHDVSRFSDSIRSSSHLPKINLPSFDGSLEKWESFRDRFMSMIQNDQNLSNVERMHYLFSCLKGDASNALTHLAITETNFPIAWQILVSRYENKRRLISIHLHTLCNLPSLNSETAKDLRDLRDKTNMAIQALKNLGCSIEYWDDIIVFLVSQKLDKSSRKAWELKLISDTVDFPTYSDLDQFLDSRLRALDAITPVNSKDNTKSTKNKVLAAHSVATVNISCPLCKTNHLLHQCSTFLSKTPSQRFDFIKRNKRCINCFSIKHAVKECTNSHLCKQCQSRKHHTLLHFDATDKPSETEVGQTSSPTDNTVDTEIMCHQNRRFSSQPLVCECSPRKDAL